MLAPDWTWVSAIPLVLVAVALLWLPGAALAAGFGAGRWPSLALAPLLTTGAVAVGGIISPFLGLRWTLPVAIAWLVLPPVVTWALRLLVHRVAGRRWVLAAPPVRWWEVGVGCAISVLVAVIVFRTATVSPGNIPQQSDQIYHLGLVRWMIDNGNISSLTADGFNFPDDPRFYPAAFHGLAATLVLLTGAPVVVVENVLLLVACALIYPLGMMFMLNTLFPGRRGVVVLTGLLALAFTGSPWKIMVWGAIWAQAFGSVFIPAVVGVYGWGLRQVFAQRNWGSAALLFGVGVPAIALAHTSALFAAAAAGLLLSVAVALRHALTRPRDVRRWLPFAGFVALAVLGPILATRLVPRGLSMQMASTQPWTRTVVRLLTFWVERRPLPMLASAGLFALAVLGIVVCVRRRDDWWLAATGVVFIALGTILDAGGPGLVWPWTWPWYNWAFRVQGVTDIYALALVVLGAAALLDWTRRVRGFALPLGGLVLAGLLVIVVVQARAAIRLVGPLYQLSGTAAWITTDKARALTELSRRMPADAVVAANPWRGGQFLYVLGPQRTAIPNEKTYGEDVDLIAHGLAQIRSEPRFCAAVQRQKVTYVITGGNMTAGNEQYYGKYAAVDEVGESGGFQVVARADPYTLWRVPDCRAQ